MKFMKPICAAAVLSCLMAFPSFAAETAEEYRTEAAVIQNEMKALEEEITPLKEENADISEKYSAVKAAWKEGQSLSISEENWEKARELRHEIKSVRETLSGISAKGQRASIKTAVQNGEYDSALAAMDQLLESKKAALEPTKQINAIWKQIEELLG